MNHSLKDLFGVVGEHDSPDPAALLSELRHRTVKRRTYLLSWRRPAFVVATVVITAAVISLPTWLSHHAADDNATGGSTNASSKNSVAPQPNLVARVAGTLIFSRADGTSVNLGDSQFENAVPVPGSSGSNPYLMLYGPGKTIVTQVGSSKRWQCLSDAVVADTLYCQTTVSNVTTYQAGLPKATFKLPIISPPDMPFLINGVLPKGLGLESRLVINAVFVGAGGAPIALLADQRTSALLNLTTGELTHLPMYNRYYAVAPCDGDLCVIGYDMSHKSTTLHVLRISAQSLTIVGDWDTSIQPNNSEVSIGEASISMMNGAIMVTIPTTATMPAGTSASIAQRESSPTTINVWLVQPDGAFTSFKSPPTVSGRISAVPYSSDSIIWWGEKPYNAVTVYNLTSRTSSVLSTSLSSMADAVLANVIANG